MSRFIKKLVSHEYFFLRIIKLTAILSWGLMSACAHTHNGQDSSENIPAKTATSNAADKTAPGNKSQAAESPPSKASEASGVPAASAKVEVEPRRTFPKFIDRPDLLDTQYLLKYLAKTAYDYINFIDPYSTRPRPDASTGNKLVAMAEQGTLKSFTGVESDGSLDISSGFVLFDPLEEVITIVFHGTRSGSIDESSLFSNNPLKGTEGWSTDLDFKMTTVNGMLFQEGFYNKYFRKDTTANLSIANQIDKNVNEFLTQWEMDPTKTRQNIRVLITGHSQGAAMVGVALYDLTSRLKAGQLWGLEAQDNSDTNRINGYMISPPSITSDLPTLAAINTVVGSGNAIAEYYAADVVADAPITSNELHSLFDLLGIYIEKKYHHPLAPGYHYPLTASKSLFVGNSSLSSRIMVLHFGSQRELGYYDPESVPPLDVKQLISPDDMTY